MNIVHGVSGRRSLRPYGCKALLVEPGYVKTNIVTAEQCVSDFEQLWRKANSPGDLTEDEEKILQSGEKSLNNYSFPSVVDRGLLHR